MRETFPVKLLLRVLQATPEEQVAIERIFDGQAFPDCQQSLPPTQQPASSQFPRPAGGLKVAPAKEASQVAPLAPPPSEQPRYALHRDGTLWHLTFEGRQAFLKHEQGICYVAEMLGHPGERLKKLSLAAKYSSPKSKRCSSIEVWDPATGKYATPASTEPVHEAPLAADDNEARNAYKARARELKDTIDDPTETEAAKAEASEELEQIIAHLSKDSRQLRDPTKAAADAVRSAINKLLHNLLEPGGSSASAPSVRREFAEHIQRYLVTPSRRYAAPKARKARGDLTGCLLYEPPAGTSWAVSF
jgi:hypothetical protein